MQILSITDLLLVSLLVMLMAGCSVVLQLGLARSMLVAALRTVLQLTLVGLILKAVFARAELVWVVVIAAVMLLVASREVSTRSHYKFSGWISFVIASGSLFLSSFTVVLFSLFFIIKSSPWYAPMYVIPLLGMILGNTMNSVSLTMNQLTQAAFIQQQVIEARLLLGETAHQAIRDIRNQAVRTGMLPSINALAVAGVVNLPGMMTGQILAGTPPLIAVKYQILINLLILLSAGLGVMFAVFLSVRRLFDERQRLRLDRLRQN